VSCFSLHVGYDTWVFLAFFLYFLLFFFFNDRGRNADDIDARQAKPSIWRLERGVGTWIWIPSVRRRLLPQCAPGPCNLTPTPACQAARLPIPPAICRPNATGLNLNLACGNVYYQVSSLFNHFVVCCTLHWRKIVFNCFSSRIRHCKNNLNSGEYLKKC